MYAFLLSKHAFLEGVHSPYTVSAKPYQKGITKSPLTIVHIHIKGTFSQTLLKRLNLGKQTSETGPGRRN